MTHRDLFQCFSFPKSRVVLFMSVFIVGEEKVGTLSATYKKGRRVRKECEGFDNETSNELIAVKERSRFLYAA